MHFHAPLTRSLLVRGAETCANERERGVIPACPQVLVCASHWGAHFRRLK